VSRALRIAALALPLLAASVAAQEEQTGRRASAALSTPQQRQQMEQQLRVNLWRIAKQRIGLTDEQMSKLEVVSRRYDAQRRAFVQDERAQRQTLRAEILAGDRADDARVSAALDRLLQLQRERVDLNIAEQKEFAAFMSPIQRAKYSALQEQIRRRVDALRRARPDSLSAAER
jgi:protein CpxP